MMRGESREKMRRSTEVYLGSLYRNEQSLKERVQEDYAILS